MQKHKEAFLKSFRGKIALLNTKVRPLESGLSSTLEIFYETFSFHEVK